MNTFIMANITLPPSPYVRDSLEDKSTLVPSKKSRSFSFQFGQEENILQKQPSEVFCEKGVLEISQISPENACESLF